MSDLKGKKVLMVIAQRNFRDEEYEKPRKVLDDKGTSIVVASSGLAEAKGMLGVNVKPDILITQAQAADYDGIILVGGSGASEYWNDPATHDLVREAYAGKKIVAAICVAPVTLAKAGLLKDRKAAVFPSQVATLQALGARCTGQKVERDGTIITASGPEAAREFGEAIAKALLA